MAKDTYTGIKMEGNWFGPDYLTGFHSGRQKNQSARDYGIRSGITLDQEIALAFQNGRHLFAEFQKTGKSPGEITDFIEKLLNQTFSHTLEPFPQSEQSLFTEQHSDLRLSSGHVPVRIVTCDFSEDLVCRRAWSGAFSELQIFLNKKEDYLWGMVTNGMFLRILRDNDRISRHAYIEADLSLILSEEGYNSFKLLWQLIHSSRFQVADGGPEKCLLEAHLNESRTLGERNRTELRRHVRFAIEALGSGFLEHPDNESLRNALYGNNEEKLSAQQYYTELLHVVYRLVFLLTLEDRDLLHVIGDSDSVQTARESYAKGYSIGELRDRCLKPLKDRYSDLWQARRIVFHALSEKGEESLALPGLGGIFESKYLPHLENCSLSNGRFLTAVKELTWTAVRGQRTAVNWRDMGAEEFGGIYEGLLDAMPVIDNGKFILEDLDGTERKQTASYYTPDSLVQAILDSALDPVLEQRSAGKSRDDAVKELLSMRVIDPACGSGHFLLGAARRIASKICSIQNDLSPEASRKAMREAVHCLHGVDLNPMAVELARMAIWLETHEAGRPLGFLGHRIQQGDSLLGILDLAVLEEGIPDTAYKVLSGDDKEVASNLKKINKQGLGLIQDSIVHGQHLIHTMSQHWHKLEETVEQSVADVHRKEQEFEKLQETLQSDFLVQSCNLYTAAFLSRKIKETEHSVPTTHDLMQLSRRTVAVDFARELCESRSVLHWPFAFPEAFEAGGFDVVLGNPPWERIKLQEEEFFADKSPEIAGARNKTERTKLIEKIKNAPENTTDRALYDSYISALHAAESSSNYCHGPRYPLTGKGDVNTYALFAETITNLKTDKGRSGMIIPSGIATDDTTKEFFAYIADGRLASLYDFENRKGIFPDVDSRQKFCLVTLGQTDSVQFGFFLTDDQEFLYERRFYSLTPDEIKLINPNTKTSPTFRSQKDAELTKKIYKHVPVLIREEEVDLAGEVIGQGSNPWGISFLRMFDMATDSNFFRSEMLADHLPLYEAKMVHHYDHRWATYTGNEDETRDITLEEKQDPDFVAQPRYWVEERQVRAKAARMPNKLCAAWLSEKEDAILKELSIWVAGHFFNETGSREVKENVKELNQNLSYAAEVHSARKRAMGDAAKFPLTDRQLDEIRECRSKADLIELVDRWTEELSPRWLLGWRDICRATDERTVIAGVIPRVAVGNNMPLFLFLLLQENIKIVALAGNLCALVLDFVARHKVGGTHLNYFLLKQLPVLTPDFYSESDLEFIVPRVVELTFTAWDLLPFAEDILDEVGVEKWIEWFGEKSLKKAGPVKARGRGLPVETARGSRLSLDTARVEKSLTDVEISIPQPFAFDPNRRATLRAELDAYYAKLYGLNREELQYILDPADIVGEDYPTETFRVLKNNEMREFGEYRTKRLVLEAWDCLT